MKPLILAVAAVLSVTAASPAHAQDSLTPIEVPADAAVVAGPTASGATLVAFDRGRQLCFFIRAPNSGEEQPQCHPPPRSVEDSVDGQTYPRTGSDDGHRGGVVTAYRGRAAGSSRG